MKIKTLKRIFINLTLTLAFLPTINGQIPSPEPVLGTEAEEDATEDETEPGVRPLNDNEPPNKEKE